MTQKFDPAPFDKHAENPKESIKVDLIVDKQLREGTVGGSRPLRTPSAPRNHHPRSTTETLIDGNLSGSDPLERCSAEQFDGHQALQRRAVPPATS